MYPVSDLALQMIRGDDRSFEWIGNITLANGIVVPYGMANIVQGSGYIRSSCSAPGIGETVCAELSMQMHLDIDEEQLKKAVIGIDCHVSSDGPDLISFITWADAEQYEWIDVNGIKWGDENKSITLDVPIGIFNINRAKRTQANTIKIVAYDNMRKFDIPISDLNSAPRSPYMWLIYVCDKCGVDIGITHYSVDQFPNGNRNLVCADVNNSIKTYRDIISQVAAALCAVAVIDRYGKLTLVPCVSEPIRTLTPSDRFSSEFEDYRTYHTGIYLDYKAGGVQEYYTNALFKEDDTGSIINLGANTLLQSSNSITRHNAMQEIINMFSGFAITPFETTIPYDPTIDLMDVIRFTGIHAPSNAMSPITDMTININGSLTLRCDVGETQSGLLREDKVVDGASGEGASGSSYGGNDFWIVIDSFPKETTAMSGASASTTSANVKTTVAKTKTQVAWTGCYILSDDAVFTVNIYANSTLIYSVSDEQKAGQHTFAVTTGHELDSEGEYEFLVTVGASENALITMDSGGARLTVLGAGSWDVSVDSGESWTDEGEILKEIADIANIDYPEDVNWDELAKEIGISSDDRMIDEDGNYVSANTYNNAVEKLKDKYPEKTTPATPPKTKDIDGQEYVSLDDKDQSGNTYPYMIAVTTKPTKTLYNSGEDIDTTGMVVTAYDISGNVWTNSNYPDGTVPLSEITIEPTEVP
jgi:hypothetical protein